MINNARFLNSTKGSYDITFLKKLGTNDNYNYELVRMNYVKNSGVEDNNSALFKSKRGSINDVKLFENISRAKRNIKELAFCNNWQWFFTGTLDKNKYDRENLELFHKDFTRFLRNFVSNNHLNNKIDFLVIPELHSDGKSWHLHGFLNNLPVEYLIKFEIGMQMSKHILQKVNNGDLVYKWKSYEDKFGFNDIEPIRNHEAVSNYITKYISKELGSCVTELGAHLYYHSRGLKKAELIKKGRMDWNFTSTIQPKIYHNDYCSILKLTNEELNKLDIINKFIN